MITEENKELLEKQHYAIIGEHSAAKLCSWTKKSIKNEGVCYKEKFYGIKSHRCCQMTPCLACTNACLFCWRDVAQNTESGWKKEWNVTEPKFIIDECIKAQKKLISGLGGLKETNRHKWKEAHEPMNFAISLSGEPTLYPKLSELIRLLHKKGKTTFLVTNGLFPEIIEKLEMPTQLYVSLDAPNEEIYKKVDNSLIPDAWKRLNKTLGLLKNLKTRTAIRLTLVKKLNMCNPKEYGKLIDRASPMFVEVKGYMHIGSSRNRLKWEQMPTFQEIKEFAKSLEKYSSYKIRDEQESSIVVLMMKKDFKERKLF